MAIEMRQQMKLTQQLVMTPQLQQAIKLLQLSRLELQDVVRQELEENPVLEESLELEDTKEPEPLEQLELRKRKTQSFQKPLSSRRLRRVRRHCGRWIGIPISKVTTTAPASSIMTMMTIALRTKISLPRREPFPIT